MWAFSQDQDTSNYRQPPVFRPLILVLVAALTLVHVLAPHADEITQPAHLPQHVAEVRNAILSAARSGSIEELRAVFEMSSGPPDFGIGGDNDPIKALKAASADGQGREILAALVDCLSMPPATLPLGSDIENNLLYVWPYLAERPLDKLTPAEEVDLYRLVNHAKAAEMRVKKSWTAWKVVIAADGTWQSFKRSD